MSWRINVVADYYPILKGLYILKNKMKYIGDKIILD